MILATIFASIAYLLLLLLVIPTLGFTKIRVDVSQVGLQVAFGPLGWPVKRLATNDLVGVEATDLRPLQQWGGWGYRWRPGRTAVVLRKGPAIEVEKTNGKSFSVTIDDAETGASVLRGYVP